MGSLGYLGATARAPASRVVERRRIARPADSGLRASSGGGVTPPHRAEVAADRLAWLGHSTVLLGLSGSACSRITCCARIATTSSSPRCGGSPPARPSSRPGRRALAAALGRAVVELAPEDEVRI